MKRLIESKAWRHASSLSLAILGATIAISLIVSSCAHTVTAIKPLEEGAFMAIDEFVNCASDIDVTVPPDEIASIQFRTCATSAIASLPAEVLIQFDSRSSEFVECCRSRGLRHAQVYGNIDREALRRDVILACTMRLLDWEAK
jgi:hypothetical protein